MLLLLTTLLSPTALARCPEPASSAEILHTAQVATESFGERRISTFQTALAQADAKISCLNELLRGDAAAALYQAQGLQAFLDRDNDAVLTRFQIARELDPDLELPLKVAPNGHPLRLLWDQALLTPAFGTLALDPPRRGALFVDGVPVDGLPADRPLLLQWMAADGRPRRSWAVADQNSLPPVISGKTRQRWSLGLGAASLGSAALAAGLWTAAGLSYQTYADQGDLVWDSGAPGDDTERDEFNHIVSRTNTLGLGAQISSGLALSLGVSAVVVRF